ncbi:hypothetical protein TWF694_008148 [Orbilia ellipsospora]|uniref:Uncharacterized protein n=1 Tax=Orbilia ellipsospora TaxID=2528407 RepID=A0AAV9XIK5_9PEZI
MVSRNVELTSPLNAEACITAQTSSVSRPEAKIASNFVPFFRGFVCVMLNALIPIEKRRREKKKHFGHRTSEPSIDAALSISGASLSSKIELIGLKYRASVRAILR